MGSREKWTAAARDVLGQEVRDAVPLVRHRPGGGWYTAVGVLALAAFVFPYEFGVIPGPPLLTFFVGALAMSLIWQLGKVPVFVVVTPGGAVVTSSTRWRPLPTAPVLGPLDPATVSGPTGLMGTTYDIGGVRHQVGLPAKGRFEQALAATRGEQAAR